MHWQDGYGVVSFGRKDLPFIRHSLLFHSRDLVLGDFLGQRVAMDAHRCRSFEQVPAILFQRLLYELLFKLRYRLIPVNALIDHLADQFFH